MVFSSLSFLLFFLPAVVAIYYICPRRVPGLRNGWLFLASLVFYGCGDLRFLPVFLGGIIWNYVFGLLIGRCRKPQTQPQTGEKPEPQAQLQAGGNTQSQARPQAGANSQSKTCPQADADSQSQTRPQAGANPELLRKVLLILCLAGDLGLLAVFKYATFILSNVQHFSGFPAQIPEIILPIGISFFTFQEISYIADVYRGAKAQRNPLYVGLYIAFFPQLIAGPILRYNDFAPQITNRKETVADFTDGFYRFSAGLCKKVLIANQLGQMTKYLLDKDGLDERCAPLLVLPVLGFGLQLYMDFSGYSDMAIGLGRMFGFRIPENFRDPYTADSATDFWRRWHISLSGWFRDYVYIPLGGSRRGTLRTILNLMTVWFLTGLWHGACWPCVLWGMIWGTWLICEKYLIRPSQRSRFFRCVYRVLTIVAAMSLFSCLYLTDLAWLTNVWRGIFSPARWAMTGSQIPALRLWLHDTGPYLAAALILSLALPRKCLEIMTGRSARRQQPALLLISTLLLLLCMVLSISFLAGSAYNPFLYFQF